MVRKSFLKATKWYITFVLPFNSGRDTARKVLSTGGKSARKTIDQKKNCKKFGFGYFVKIFKHNILLRLLTKL